MKVKDKINFHIKHNGYITIDEFMRLALSDCLDSYYRNNNPIGSESDFITGPEISQMFGEMIGMWVLQKWIELGSPNKINLIELGPGKGTLLKNLLNITKYVKNFHKSLNIHLIEINEKLIGIQKKSLSNFNIKWSKNLYSIENNYPTIFIGNEFFDSLPIKQYIMNQNNWYERVITIDFNGKFIYKKIVIEDQNIIKYLIQYKSAHNGSIIEISEDSRNYINLIKSITKENKTFCLFIDYGYYINPIIRKSNQYNSTLQAIKTHKYCDIFYDIGNCDLTSHVDFLRLSYFATEHGFQVQPVISQKEFLVNCGIDQRLIFLSQDKDKKLQNILLKQYNRLVSETEMGSLFKVLEFNR